MITQIWERLFIGSLKDAERLAFENPAGITTVLSLCPEQIEKWSKNIHYVRIPISDGCPIVEKEFEEIMAAMEQGLRRGNLLIHCAAGYSRSPVVAAAWMHRHGYLNFDSALQEIGRLRPTTDPSPVLVKSVKEELSR